MERNKIYSYKVSDFGFTVWYKCLDMNCDLQPEDKNKYEDQVHYRIKLKEQMFFLNLQENSEPIKLTNIPFSRELIS